MNKNRKRVLILSLPLLILIALAVLVYTSFFGIPACAREHGQQEKDTGSHRGKPIVSRKTQHRDMGDGIELTRITESINGRFSSRFVKVTRDGQTLITCEESLGGGVRTYYHNGAAVVQELYEENGHIKGLILVDHNERPVEVFERKKDGVILPVSSRRLKKMKKLDKLISETFQPVVDAARSGASRQELKKRLTDAARKVSDAAEEERRTEEKKRNPGSANLDNQQDGGVNLEE